MTPYLGANNSPIISYFIKNEEIFIEFKSGVYKYSYKSAGVINVETMKILATRGAGLYSFIYHNAFKNYEKKYTNEEWEIATIDKIIDVLKPDVWYEDKGICPLPDILKEFDFRSYIRCEKANCGLEHDLLPIDHTEEVPFISYNPSIAREDRIPGLICLICKEFDEIAKHIKSYFNIEINRKDIRINLSDRKVVQSFGEMSSSDIISILRNIVSENTPITKAELDDLVHRQKITGTIGGIYDRDTRTITIYYRVLSTKNGLNGYLACLRQVLAHEMLHHANVSDIDRGNIMSKMYVTQACRIKEALADFYANIYLVDSSYCIWGDEVYRCSQDTANLRYNQWKQQIGTLWPYAYALFFMKNPDGTYMPFYDDINEYINKGCIEKYISIFEKSKSSLDFDLI